MSYRPELSYFGVEICSGRSSLTNRHLPKSTSKFGQDASEGAKSWLQNNVNGWSTVYDKMMSNLNWFHIKHIHCNGSLRARLPNHARTIPCWCLLNISTEMIGHRLFLAANSIQREHVGGKSGSKICLDSLSAPGRLMTNKTSA